MAKIKPIIQQEYCCEEGWDDDIHGRVRWGTLFSSDHTPTEALTAGVGEILPGDKFKVHRHETPELYYLLSGEGTVTIEGVEYPVKTNTAIFIPSNTAHGLQNTGQITLRFFYVFAINSFSEVKYIFAR